ncbi:NAD(P)/FAD-dependent oxidoreductase [Lentisalinibacter salinarum]|uniref:NAD(P)/FAD-dependent oxidoreductase n=1 Tax=Lentisalinibacter salinarum TaxID=2992239 RepID=UPI003865BDE3
MRILILGAGPAGISVAENIRDVQEVAGSAPEIAMVSAEPFPPYSPPAMADHFLTGDESRLYWKGNDICERLEVEYHPGSIVTGIDAEAHRVSLAEGEPLAYDRLVIATGSRLHAPVEGATMPGVYNFKSLSAARELVEHARRGEMQKAVIVGAGFIGVEVALVLADLGLDVTLVEQAEGVMPRMLDEETADIVRRALVARGVRVLIDTTASAFAGNSRARAVVLESGDVITADACIAATGVKPNIDFVAGGGFDVGWGVRVDDRLHTGVANVWAAGDCAETRDRMTGERFVHAIFPNAINQARVVAEQLMGFETLYEGAETMNSLRHLGVPVMAVGELTGDAEAVRSKADSLRRIVLRDGRIVGFRLAGDIRGAGVYRSLMLRRIDVGAYGEGLADPAFIDRHLADPFLQTAA